MSDELRARPDTLGDCDDLGEVHVAGWQSAYRGIVDDAHLDAMRAQAWADGWRERLPVLPDGHRVAVAELDGRVVGFCRVGPLGGTSGAVGELGALYVHPDRWGSGAGRLLIHWAHEELVADGYDRAQLVVFEQNLRARAFYERHGWHDTGLRSMWSRGPLSVTEARYERRL